MHLSPDTAAKARALTRVVAVNPYGRSGSMFLQSLFDGHPHIITVPGVYLTAYHGFYHLYGSLPKDALIEKFVEQFAVIFDANNDFPGSTWHLDAPMGEHLGFTRMGPNKDETLTLDREAFIACLKTVLDKEEIVSRKLLFQALHVAYQHALYPEREITKDTVILFHLHDHSPSFRQEHLDVDFSDAQYLHVVREPVRTLKSLFKGFPKLDPELLLYDSLFGGIPMNDKIRSRSRVIRIEDLNANPRDVLMKVCSWIGIDWNDCLMNSTFHGLTWWGDILSKPATGFVTRQPTNEKETAQARFDTWRLQCLLQPQYETWKYETKMTSSGFEQLLVLPTLLFPIEQEFVHDSALNIETGTRKRFSEAYNDFRYGFWRRWFRIRLLFCRAWKATLAGERRPIDLL